MISIYTLTVHVIAWNISHVKQQKVNIVFCNLIIIINFKDVSTSTNAEY